LHHEPAFNFIETHIQIHTNQHSIVHLFVAFKLQQHFDRNNKINICHVQQIPFIYKLETNIENTWTFVEKVGVNIETSISNIKLTKTLTIQGERIKLKNTTLKH
jgi:hypothetical protein